jgi:4-hydroxy-tetrahydrodipicolinate reductase
MGRMGKRICTLIIEEFKDLHLAAAIERHGHPSASIDIGALLGLPESIGVALIDRFEQLPGNVDVIIDFSTPEATLKAAAFAAENKIAFVTGTTGVSAKEKDTIKALAEKIPCVMAPNMSVGINLLLKILSQAASIIGHDYDIEIVEAHHRLKKDAPSGTALRMAEVIAGSLNRDLEKVGVYARKGLIGERTKTEIGIQTVRAGDIVGEHTVMFATGGERIEFTHKASSRDTFARGAIRAARWVYGKAPGLYDMQDVLGL